MTEYKFFDANGYEWRFDGKRVYMVDAENEMKQDNGYGCYSAEEALELMEEFGYMEKE
jgi:hypothetical protein